MFHLKSLQLFCSFLKLFWWLLLLWNMDRCTQWTAEIEENVNDTGRPVGLWQHSVVYCSQNLHQITSWNAQCISLAVISTYFGLCCMLRIPVKPWVKPAGDTSVINPGEHKTRCYHPSADWFTHMEAPLQRTSFHIPWDTQVRRGSGVSCTEIKASQLLDSCFDLLYCCLIFVPWKNMSCQGIFSFSPIWDICYILHMLFKWFMAWCNLYVKS